MLPHIINSILMKPSGQELMVSLHDHKYAENFMSFIFHITTHNCHYNIHVFTLYIVIKNLRVRFCGGLFVLSSYSLIF